MTTARAVISPRLIALPRSLSVRGLGLVVGHDAITLVVLARGGRRFVQTSPRLASEPLGGLLEALLKDVPDRIRRRPLFILAAGSDAHVRRIHGVPSSAPVILRAVIAADPERFFPATRDALQTAGVRVSEQGCWSAAYSRSLVEAVTFACERTLVRRVTLMPSAAAIGGTRQGRSATYQDGPIQVHAEYDGRGWLTTLTRQVMPGMPARPHEPADLASDDHPDHIEPIAIDAVEGAMRLAGRDPLAMRMNFDRSARVAKWRFATVLGLCAVGLLVTVAGPAVRDAMRIRNLEEVLSANAAVRSAASHAQAELGASTRVLEALGHFDERAGSTTRLLAAITRVLPSGSALVLLRIDSLSGSAVVIAPRAADVVSAFEHVPGLASPSIVGPIAPDPVAGQAPGQPSGTAGLERVTIQFSRVGRS